MTGGEFCERDVVGIVLLEAGRYRSEMLELVEEALDQGAVSAEPGAEGRDVNPV